MIFVDLGNDGTQRITRMWWARKVITGQQMRVGKMYEFHRDALS
jgi:hypothetical protein